MNTTPIILSPETEAQLRDSLRRCSPETVAAAIAYRQTSDTQFLPVVISGIFERYVEPDIRARLTAPHSDELRVIEDLAIDSLTLMEIVMLVEEIGGVVIANEELRQLRTLGNIKTFVECRARGLPYAPPVASEVTSDPLGNSR
jgi:3-hydroxyacyl-[acyl-carrier-protein] dehydratase